MELLPNLLIALVVIAVTYFTLSFLSSPKKGRSQPEKSQPSVPLPQTQREAEAAERTVPFKEKEKEKEIVGPSSKEKGKERGAAKGEDPLHEENEPAPSAEEMEILGKDLDQKIQEEEEERGAQRRLEKGKGRDLGEHRREASGEGEVVEEEEDELAGIDFSMYDEPSPDFRIVKSNTRCPFAKNSLVMNGSRWDFNLTLEQNVVNSIPLLELFNKRVARGEDLDAFLIEIEEERYGDTIESLSKTVKKTLTILSDNDPSGENAMAEDLRSNFWNFHFGTEYQAYFISVLAPCYHKNHSRFAYGSKHTFILLQPEISFHNKSIKLDYDPKSVRHLVRKRFLDVGQPYDPRDAKEYTMCNWVVRPMEVHQPPIRWWEVSIADWE